MTFDIVSIFPDLFLPAISHGVIGKAVEAGIIEVNPIDLRDFTHDRHKTTDDRPFGGGEGMVMTPEPVFEALEHLKRFPSEPKIIFMTPRGIKFTQKIAQDLSKEKRLILICGRYEGLDERICQNCIDLELSIGDYVLSGGELPALVVMDAVGRLIPGVLGCDSSAQNDSFSNGLLEHPQYTRPRDFRGWKVPEVLLSGDHAKIEKWRREQSLIITTRRRPDLIKSPVLSAEEKRVIESGEPE